LFDTLPEFIEFFSSFELDILFELDIYCFPVPVAIRTDENLLQAKLAEPSLLFSKFYNSSTNTFEINI